ncbi:MFS monocarboxylate transporter-like protein [Pestalotiopsis sp. NC0098]|nr:MFS monocarboxylate transporter-like protein [Pestalotiopsis sp. NC0098]
MAATQMSTGTDSPPEMTELKAKEGRGAWIQVLGAFLVYVATWGLLSTYGTYQSYYETVLLTGRSTDQIVWIGTIEGVLLILGGVTTGPIYDRGHVRELLFCGTVITVLGVMMLSLASEYWQIMLAQGLCIGVGSGILYTPSISLVAATFGPKHRGLAVCLATCGTAVGGVLYPVILDQLLPRVGFSWATRVLGFVTLAELILAMACIIPYIDKAKANGPQRVRSLFDPTAFKDLDFVVMCLGVFFIWLAYWVPFFLIPTFAESALGASSSLAFYLLVIINAASIPGRLLAAFIIPYVDNAGGMVAFGLASTIVLFAWCAVKTTAGFVAWAIVLGVAMAPLAVFQPTIVPQLTPRVELVGTRMGIALAFAAFGVLAGVPISSSLVNTRSGEFWKMQVFLGCCMVVGTLLMLFVWWRLRRPNAQRPIF